MSEEEVVTNPIEDLVQAAMTQDYTAANEIFNDMMSDKISDALDQEKIAMADQIYNGHSAEGEAEDDDYVVPEEDDEDLDVDLDDEDLDLEDEEIEDFDEVED